LSDNSDDLIISISTDLATVKRSLNKLVSDVGQASSGIEKKFAATGKAINASLSSSMQKQIEKMVGVGAKGAKEWNGVLADQGKELERLRAQYSPLFAVIHNYKQAVSEIRRAHAVGAISANEMAAAISKERQSALASTAAIKGRNAALANTPIVGKGGNSSHYTSNIAAQFQDIGVTAMGGMSPVQIAFQQGTQLSAVLNDMKASGQGAGAALAAAFTSIISPVSLVTIGLVAASAAAIQYFSGILSNDDEAAGVLKEQAQLISMVAERWGDTIPVLREYADQLRRAQDSADLREGAKIINEKTLAGIKKQVDDSVVSFSDLISKLRLVGEQFDIIDRLERSFAAFTKAAKDGKLETADVERVQTALADAVNSSGIPAISTFASAFKDLAGEALTANKNVQGVMDAVSRSSDITTWRSYNKETGKLGLEDQTNDGPIQGESFATPEDGPVPTSRPLIELTGMPWVPKAKAESAAKKTAEDRFAADMRAMNDRTAALKQEIALVGQSNEEQVRRRAALNMEQNALADLREEARKRGETDLESITLSPDKINAINREAAAYAEQVQVLQKVQDAQQNAENAAREFYDTAKSGFADVVTGAESLNDALSNLLKKLGDLMLNSAFDSAFGGSSASGSGGWLTGVAKALGFADGGKIQAFAGGGKLSGPGTGRSDDILMWGSNGEYMVNAASTAKYLPLLEAINKNKLPAFASGGLLGGGSIPQISTPRVPDLAGAAANRNSPFQINYNPVIDARGADSAAVARLEQALAQDRKMLPAQVVNAIRDARARGVKI
jgi:hypothetical protein